MTCHDPKIRTQRSRSITPVAQVLEFYETLAVVNPRRACSNLVNEVSTDRRGRVCIHLILSRCLLHSSPRYRRIARKSSVLVEASFRLFASGESISFSRVCGMARLDLTNRPPSLFHFSSLFVALSVPLSFSLCLPLSLSRLYRIASRDESWPNRSGPIYLVRFSLQRQVGYLGYSVTFSRLFWYLEYWLFFFLLYK